MQIIDYLQSADSEYAGLRLERWGVGALVIFGPL